MVYLIFFFFLAVCFFSDNASFVPDMGPIKLSGCARAADLFFLSVLFSITVHCYRRPVFIPHLQSFVFLWSWVQLTSEVVEFVFERGKICHLSLVWLSSISYFISIWIQSIFFLDFTFWLWTEKTNPGIDWTCLELLLSEITIFFFCSSFNQDG